MKSDKIKAQLETLTLEEKVSLTTGNGNWNTHSIDGKAIPTIRMSDGPHGLRLQVGDQNNMNGDGLKSVCYPAASATAASFDRKLLYRLGEALGQQAKASDVQLILGPGVNIKRHPLCGRNFEYFSEDPMLAGELAASLVQGIQEQGVGACLKHFFANNQEYRRMDSSSELSERTKREIYFPAFERVVKKAQPWAVMASYNKIDGTYSTENKKYLQNVLRDEWKFDGAVISDWGATHDRVAAVEAGCDLTMPGVPETNEKVIEAVKNGTLDESRLDTSCEKVLQLVNRGLHAGAGAESERKSAPECFMVAGHALAADAAAQSIVLLKNDREMLPLQTNARVAFIGEFAVAPRYQGGGSSHINSFCVTSAMEAMKKAELDGELTFAQGYHSEKADEALLAQAVETAAMAQAAVLYVGLTENMESEGYDRQNLSLPESHEQLIEKVVAVQPNTIVVLHGGSPVIMPWLKDVVAVLQTYLGGQAIGQAVVDVLYGKVNPSGRLPESYPLRLEDTPAYLSFPGDAGIVRYGEGIFVGYRYYESRKMKVLFPFGHGLSYTTFSYDNLRSSSSDLSEDTQIEVFVDVTNTGKYTGREVVQLYISPCKGTISRPVKELKAFDKIELLPGETKTVRFTLEYRDFACWSEESQGWYACSGEYQIKIAKSADDVVIELPITMESKPVGVKHYDEMTMLREFVANPIGKKYFDETLPRMIQGMAAAGLIPKEAMTGFSSPEGMVSGTDMLLDMTVSLLLSFNGADEEEKIRLFEALNN